MVLSTGVGGAIQMILFLIAAAITATSRRHQPQQLGGSISLWSDRGRRRADRRRALHPQDPRQGRPGGEEGRDRHLGGAAQPEEGHAALRRRHSPGNLIYPALLGLCLLGVRLAPRLRPAHRRAGRRGHARQRRAGSRRHRRAGGRADRRAHERSASPRTSALATVIVFRGITFAIPPIFGFFTLRWQRAKGLRVAGRQGRAPASLTWPRRSCTRSG